MPTIEQGASSVSSLISLSKTIIGAGLLSMPLAFSTDGVAFGIFIILLAAATSGYGLFLQCYVSKYVPKGHATFFNICSITCPAFSVIFDLAITIQCFGCAVSYLVLVGDIVPSVITYVPYIKEEHYRTFWILISGFICIPLSFLKNLDSLKYTSILGLVAIFYLTLLVITHFFIGVLPEERGNIIYFPHSVTDVFSTFSIIVFAFTGHQNMFSIINEARDKSLCSLSRLVNFVILGSSFLFIIVGLAGYLTYGDNVGGNIILLFPNSLSTKLGKLSIVFMVLFSFPLMLHPSRISINNIYFWFTSKSSTKLENESERTALLPSDPLENSDEISIKDAHIVPFPNVVFNVITALLLIMGYSLAISVKSFALVLAVVGATGSTAISFILPGLFGYGLIGSELDDPSTLEIILKRLSLLLVIWGFAVMILCLYSSLFLN